MANFPTARGTPLGAYRGRLWVKIKRKGKGKSKDMPGSKARRAYRFQRRQKIAVIPA